MPFPNNTFGKEVDPREAALKSVKSRGDYYHWSRVTKCDKRCPYFNKGCIYISLSRTPSYGGKCAVKTLDPKTQGRMIRFLEGKQTDFIANMMELYQEMENSVKVRKDPQLLMQLFDRLAKLYQTVYPSKNVDVVDDSQDSIPDMFDEIKSSLEVLENEEKKFRNSKDDKKVIKKIVKKSGDKKPKKKSTKR